MEKKMYVGNLPFNSTEDEVHDLFQNYCDVRSVNIIYDRETGRSRGFGFVEINENDNLQKVIEDVNGYEFQGRHLKVNEARPRG